MNACTRGTGLFRDQNEFVAVDISETDVCKGRGQTYFFAEGVDDGGFIRRSIDELKPGQKPNATFSPW